MSAEIHSSQPVPPVKVDYLPERAEADSTQWVPPPLGMLPTPLRTVLEAIAVAQDIDASMALLPALTVLSATIGNARAVQLSEGWHVPPVVWTAVVAGSGDGKSPAMDVVMSPVIREQKRLAAQYKQDRIIHDSEYRKWKQAKDGTDPPEPPRLSQLYVSDVTVEATGVRLEENRRGLMLYVDELAAFTKGWGAYKSGGGSDREFYLAAYDARTAKVDRKGGVPPTLFIPNAFVAVTGTTQPRVLAGMLSDEIVACGFAARLLLAMPPPRARRFNRAGVSRETRDAFAAIVDGLRNLSFDANAECRHAVLPTTDAVDVFEQWYHEMQDIRLGESPAMCAAIAKLTEMAARLALIFHCVDVVTGAPGVEPDVLNTTSMRAGVAFARWFLGEARRVYAILGESASEAAERSIVDVIRAAGGSVTTRELMRRVHRFNKGRGAADRAREALDVLVRGGRARWEGTGKDARCVLVDEFAELLAALER